MDYKVIFEKYASSVYEKDIEGLLSIYDSKFYILDTWNDWLTRDIKTLRHMVTEWFESLGEEKVRVEFNEIQLIESPNQIVWVGEFKYYGLSKDDQILRSISNRWTWVIKNNNGNFKVVHEHSSLPVSPETFKGITKKDE